VRQSKLLRCGGGAGDKKKEKEKESCAADNCAGQGAIVLLKLYGEVKPRKRLIKLIKSTKAYVSRRVN
jgi:hypothetical protein